jgi:hypothetical protein
LLWDEPKIFFLERRYFFSIILSEFLKNRVALQLNITQILMTIQRSFPTEALSTSPMSGSKNFPRCAVQTTPQKTTALHLKNGSPKRVSG